MPSVRPGMSSKLLERQIQKQVKDFLRWKGWRIVRHQVTVASTGASTFSVGEKGMADLQAIYYLNAFKPGLTLTLWVETKRLGKKLRPEQETWKQHEEVRGGLYWKADHIGEFIEQYERIFGWLHTDDRVKGQKAITFEDVTRDLSVLTNSVATGSPR
jgi:hypothetical protein